MSWTRCVAGTELRLREGAPSTQQTRPSSPGGRAGFPALAAHSPGGRVVCESSSPSSPGLCGHCGRRAAPARGLHRSSCCGCSGKGLRHLWGVFPLRVLGGTLGSWGGRVFHQACFQGDSTASAPTTHQQWLGGASWAAALPALGIPRLFILVRLAIRKCVTRRFETSQFPGNQ